MNSPTTAARKLLHDYFANRGQLTPEEQATSFLGRIHMLSDGSWRSYTLIETGIQILDIATFDVDDFVENHLHVRLSIESLREYDKQAGSPVFGVAFPKSRSIAICDRAEEYQPLYRTCVAHEVAHIILHGNQSYATAMNYSPGSRRRPPEEHEADEFMISLLAPRSVLELATGFAAQQAGLHMVDVWRRANTRYGQNLWREFIFPRLIDRMCLSRLLISIQMRKFGVFTDATVEYHKTYRLPNRWRPDANTVSTLAG